MESSESTEVGFLEVGMQTLRFYFSLFIILLVFFAFPIPAVSIFQVQPAVESTFRGDINEDGRLDIFDLLEMLKMLSSPEGQPERIRQIADVDESGSVDIFDLLGLLKVLSGAEEPGIIYWEPVIASLSQRVVDPGDTLTIYVENFDEATTADSVKAYIDDREVDLLEFSLESIMIIIPEWFNSGKLELVVGTDTTNSIYIVKIAGIPGITMVSLPADSFRMGTIVLSPGLDDEWPAHTVTLDAFQISATEITNAQYAAYLNQALKAGEITATKDSVIGASGEYSGQTYLEFYKGFIIDSTPIDTINRCYIKYDYAGFNVVPDKENWPVVFVTWYGAYAFAKHYGISLPTEAEWEYACRGGKQYKYGTDDGTISSEKANYNYDPEQYVLNFPEEAYMYSPNPFDLFNMAGNVREWCSDWYDPTYYFSSPRHNPPGPEYGKERVARGGSWNTCEEACRSANRIFHEPSYRISYLGFRVVRR